MLCFNIPIINGKVDLADVLHSDLSRRQALFSDNLPFS
jgi:hypothetical protein